MSPTDDAKKPTARRYRPILRHIALLTTLALAVMLTVWKRPFAWPETAPQHASAVQTPPQPDTFELKHIFHHGAGSRHYRVHRRLDITPQYLQKAGLDAVVARPNSSAIASNNLEEVYRQNDWPRAYSGHNPWTMRLKMRQSPAKSTAVRLKERHSPGFIDAYLDYARSVRGNPKILNQINLEWEYDTDVPVPSVNDKETLVNMAVISSNAYVRFPHDDKEKKKSDWVDVGDPWKPDQNNSDVEFGWDGEGVRGHVFVNEHDKIVVISLKGTSGAAIPGGGSDETSKSDQLNDNLLFSCCCARVSYLWTTVCDCYEKAYTCNQDCLEKELMRKDRYYQAALEIYRNVSAIYRPEDYNIWVTGHSLGGSLASLLGRTYGLPAVAFEAPGELLATQRLHLPRPPGIPRYMENIWHIGNTADPIFMGVCNGVSSTCNAAGYAMETACHTGKMCVYDVVTDKGWSVSVLNHRIHTVIDEIILTYNETANCVEQPPCRDCFNWRFVAHDEDEPDEPKLPNPLKPHRSRTVTTHSSSSSSSTSVSSANASSTNVSSSDPGTPQKCLKRTWYGWCSEWSNADDENTPDPSYQNGKE